MSDMSDKPAVAPPTASMDRPATKDEDEVVCEKVWKAKRAVLFQSDRAVVNLCLNNGINEAAFVNKSAQITSIEMCFYNYPKITALNHFANITSLCIVAQEISEIEGIDECRALEQLWICETKVSRIQNLSRLKALKKLYLYSNRIKEITGLEELTKLSKLWLGDNDISHLENLNTLKDLTELHIGNNKIVSIGDALNENVNLQELNIAGNRLASFRVVLSLARLPRLTSLCLSDPSYADNPICSLCNYQTHVIYHLPALRSLDTLDITEESRRLINATVLKKRMYYNMRIRTIKRNTNFLIKMVKTRSNSEETALESDIQNLLSKAKMLQKRRDDLVNKGKIPSGGKKMLDQLDNGRSRLHQLIEGKLKSLSSFKNHRLDIETQIIQQSDMAIRKLLLELETGGNVRFEDEHVEDPWFKTCESLVKTLILRAVSSHSHKRIQIHRISRLHNRNLKNKFESKLQTKPEPDRGSFEYLSFQNPDSHAEEIFSVVEYGFASNFVTDHTSGLIALANYLDCSDNAVDPHDHNKHRKKLRQAIIAKVFTARSGRVSENITTPVNLDDFHGLDCIHQMVDLPGEAKEGRSEREASRAAAERDPCRRYYIFDRDLVLPEFFVEYSIESEFDHLTTKIEKFMIDVAYSSKLSRPDMPWMINEVSSKIGSHAGASPAMRDMSIASLEKMYPEINCGEAISEYSVYPANIPLDVEHLNISFSNRRSLDEFDQHTNIKTLIISHNNLSAVTGLHVFTLIERLDLSFNKLQSVHGLESLKHLKYLDLTGNLISELSSLQNVYQLFTAGTSLISMDAKFNPICQRKGYRLYICSSMPSLVTLDGISTDSSDRVSLHIDWDELIADHSSSQPHLFRPLSVRTQSGPGSTASQNDFWRLLPHPNHGTLMLEGLTTLELDSCDLFDLEPLPVEMINLRWASFRNNYLSDVSRLTHFPKLEELSIENNEIHQIDSLSVLPNLSKLDASNNRLTTVDSACNFKSIMLMSLENNFIQNLKPFAKSTTLMEFYVGNNSISSLYGIFPLKELPRLIILDLTGNAVCQLQNYRLFTIFHLSKLKILDGAGITAKEQISAKDVYLGKLTVELLGEKIGHFSFKNITELDLRNCKIREVNCFNMDDFRNLRKLNFDNNLLTTIDCIAGLTGLKSLSLNMNRIERLLLTDIPSASGRNDGTPDGRRPLLPFLEELHLGYNSISKISDLGLYRMPYLKILYLQGNRILRVDGLEHMTSLIELVLDKNQIKAAEPSSFFSLINLKELHIKDNRIKTLAHFDCLPNLQNLHLSNNRVQETCEIEKMKLPSLKEINLSINGIARKQAYRFAVIMRFPLINIVDGKEVTDEERQRAEIYFMEQCILRDDPSAKINMPALQASSANGSPMNSLVKLPIKITSVVLDGLEMKLAANSSGFGSQNSLTRPS